MELKGVRMGVLTCFDVEVILLSHSCLLCARTFSVVIADHGSALCMKGGGARSTFGLRRRTAAHRNGVQLRCVHSGHARKSSSFREFGTPCLREQPRLACLSYAV